MVTTFLSDLINVVLIPGGIGSYEFNYPLLDLYKKLKNRGLSVNLFTSSTVQDDPQIKPVLESVFENIYSASYLNINKKDPKAYLKVAGLLAKRPEEILFIDDQKGNIEAARQAGLQILWYENFKAVKSELDKL